VTKIRGIVAGSRGAAATLGIPAQTLQSTIKQLGVEKRRFATAPDAHPRRRIRQRFREPVTRIEAQKQVAAATASLREVELPPKWTLSQPCNLRLFS
jgi:hypothetical protein